ncbi:MAG: Xaa-Pro peptidase family protein [Actinomycetia bacterium]|nr:Xaa-Pro peptidase family protein [Actinomycetes bacterium]
MLINTSRATALMNADGVDGIVSATLENNLYLSGVYVDAQYMFPRDSEYYVVASADKPEAGTIVCSIGEADLTLIGHPTIADVVTFGTFFRDIVDGPELDADERRVREITAAHQTGRASVDALAEAITKMGLAEGVLAIDERGPNRDLFARLGELLPKAELRPASVLFRRIRAVKTDEEVERVIAALRATEAGLRAAYDAFEVGVTEREIKGVFERTVIAHGARPGFLLCRFGKGLALGQIPPGDTKLAKGDFAFFDVGVNLDGYKSDIGRLVSFGEPNPAIVELFKASKAGQQTAIDMMRPGVVAGDVFDAAVARVRAEGIPSYKRQHVGHGIGIEYYDLPVLAPGADTVLEANMTFEVETPYYRLGVGGAFIEDTVLVTDSGARILTTLSRDLQVIEPR